ncbi:hypothetical protein [Streptomyces sp. NPDC088350]
MCSGPANQSDIVERAVEQHGKGGLGALLAGNDTWTVTGPARS